MTEPRYDYEVSPGDMHGQTHAFYTLGRAAVVAVWCTAQFGPPSHDGRWSASHSTDSVYIRDETDALQFRLRWC